MPIPECAASFGQDWSEIIVHGEAAARMVHLHGLAAVTGRMGIQDPDVGKDWRRLSPHVPQIRNALHGRVVVIDFEFSAAQQSSFTILVSDRLAGKAFYAIASLLH